MKLIKFCIYSISRIFLLSIVLVSCNNQSKPTKAIITPAKLIQYVDPMIGTDKMGHTYPGATVPFGSIQLSPDTDTIPYAVDGNNIQRFINIVPVTNMMILQLLVLATHTLAEQVIQI